jgi:hypothetical protein
MKLHFPAVLGIIPSDSSNNSKNNPAIPDSGDGISILQKALHPIYFYLF